MFQRAVPRKQIRIFNTPYGKYKNPNIVNAQVIRAVSSYLNTANVQIHCQDYADVLHDIPSNAFIYLDPPYYPLSPGSSFTAYVKGGWRETDQIRLRDLCRKLDEQGIRFLQSNSSAPFIRDIYKDFNIFTVHAARMINSKGSGRTQVEELLISNFTVPV